VLDLKIHEEVSTSLVTSAPAAAPHRTKLAFEDADALRSLCGERGATLKLIEREAGVELHVRGNEITVAGDDAAAQVAEALLKELYGFARRGSALTGDEVLRAARVLRADHNADLRSIFSDTVFVPRSARPITPKGLAQKRYVDAVRKHDIVFAIGPAGTGKTYLAMALAVRDLIDKRVKRIILTRPAVEAGERLGFLPGTMEEKVNPYLRPLYDALHDMLDFDRVRHLIDRGVIEVAPLAFMRGRTLNDSFVIFDEAQNATSEQMKMFLTRLGFGARAVVTGDITQSDLPRGTRSGLREAGDLLRGIEGISICHFSEADVVRHPLVQEIIRAYERKEASQHAAAAARDAARASPGDALPAAEEAQQAGHGGGVQDDEGPRDAG
jgi:phosphate starvation-inducible PhoH-like protein